MPAVNSMAISRAACSGRACRARSRRWPRQAPSPVLGLVAGVGLRGSARAVEQHRRALDAARQRCRDGGAAQVRRVSSIRSIVSASRIRGRKRTAGKAKALAASAQGGAGGSHIGAERHRARQRVNVYFQERVTGVAVSALFVGNGKEARVLGFSEQWTGHPSGPFRYGGAVRPARLAAKLQDEMTVGGRGRTSAFKLKGLGSADFIVDGQSAHCCSRSIRARAPRSTFSTEAKPAP